MNHTLVELARAMQNATNLPEFLWESAISHTAYIRNRSFTKPLKTTPYQIWYGKKPDISHLWEFGTSVWVLLQGQHQQHKMLLKSKCRALVGYDDGSKSIQYFNAETRNILTSRNFRFLNPLSPTPPEEIAVEQDSSREGEDEESALPNAQDALNAPNRVPNILVNGPNEPLNVPNTQDVSKAPAMKTPAVQDTVRHDINTQDVDMAPMMKAPTVQDTVRHGWLPSL